MGRYGMDGGFFYGIIPEYGEKITVVPVYVVLYTYYFQAFSFKQNKGAAVHLSRANTN